MKKISAVMFAFFVISASRPVFGASAEAGTKGCSGINLGGSPRSLAMGGAGVAGIREPAAIWVNPGQLASLRTPEMSFTHGAWLMGVSLEQLAVAYPTPLGHFGGALAVLQVKDVESFDKNGVQTGDFSPSDTRISGAYAVSAGKFSLGAAVSYLKSTLAEGAKASAVAGDFGVSFKPDPAFTVSAAVMHVGSALKYDKSSVSLPLTLRGGASFLIPRTGITLAADAVKPGDSGSEFRAGVEKELKLVSELSVSLRGGWHSLGPTGGTSGLTAGGGLCWRPLRESGGGGPLQEISAVRIDYAWTPMGELGVAHWFLFALVF